MSVIMVCDLCKETSPRAKTPKQTPYQKLTFTQNILQQVTWDICPQCCEKLGLKVVKKKTTAEELESVLGDFLSDLIEENHR